MGLEVQVGVILSIIICQLTLIYSLFLSSFLLGFSLNWMNISTLLPVSLQTKNIMLK